jgi:hypothetical protein
MITHLIDRIKQDTFMIKLYTPPPNIINPQLFNNSTCRMIFNITYQFDHTSFGSLRNFVMMAPHMFKYGYKHCVKNSYSMEIYYSTNQFRIRRGFRSNGYEIHSSGILEAVFP